MGFSSRQLDCILYCQFDTASPLQKNCQNNFCIRSEFHIVLKEGSFKIPLVSLRVVRIKFWASYAAGLIML